ncbi:MAG: hypothetical protein H2058_11865 [Muricauda sp.]|nr:MauE/DoxX family redox-associated membrane protein [Allomuricauda sp.]MBA4745942.1 hypothetical protein [Allomuricauda sp.]
MMKRLPHYKTNTITVIATLYIFLWVYAASSKLWDFHQFTIQLGQSPVLTAYANEVAWGIPIAEYLLAIILVFHGSRLWGFYGSFALMVMFTTYIVLVLNFSDYIPCSCGGVLEDMGWTEHIVFNMFFVALAVIAIIVLESSAPIQKSKTLKPSP